jgi:hypothetical protein
MLKNSSGELVTFHATCISYIEMWEGNFQEVEQFSWINQNYMKWTEVETTAELVNIKMGQFPINIDHLFDEVCWVERFFTQQAGNWEKYTSAVKRTG